MRSIDVVEGQEFELPTTTAERLRAAVERLEAKLRPVLRFLTEKANVFRLNNLIGTVELGGGVVLNVSPKVETDEHWATNVVSLLTGYERVDIAGERKAGYSPLHRNLVEAISRVYLERLERAYRQDGPIMLMERLDLTLPHLHGKLHVSKWVRSALWRPHMFPVTLTRLAQDNPFTRALIDVALTLSRASTIPQTKAGLAAIARDLSAGVSGTPNGSNASVTRRSIPEQWSAYKPAWSLAVAVLTKASLLGPVGHHLGVGIAIEPWRLLETLLKRTLLSIEEFGQQSGRGLNSRMKGNVGLLEPLGARALSAFDVQPDGRLYENGNLIATFEAKYKVFDSRLPDRDDIYQALSTAAACDAPLAILVYPNKFEPCLWAIDSFGGKPAHLAAFGLELFKWMPPHQANERAKKLIEFIDLVHLHPHAAPLKAAA